MVETILFVGINGVGKSTVAEKLHELLPESVVINPTTLLMQALHGKPREELEKMDAKEKDDIVRVELAKAYQEHAQKRYILLDTHMRIAIRQQPGEEATYLGLLEDAIMPEVQKSGKAYLLLDDPLAIQQRREEDLRRTGRRRDVNIDDITIDQAIELFAFKGVMAKYGVEGRVITTTGLGVEGAAHKIMRDLGKPPRRVEGQMPSYLRR